MGGFVGGFLAPPDTNRQQRKPPPGQPPPTGTNRMPPGGQTAGQQVAGLMNQTPWQRPQRPGGGFSGQMGGGGPLGRPTLPGGASPSNRMPMPPQGGGAMPPQGGGRGGGIEQQLGFNPGSFQRVRQEYERGQQTGRNVAQAPTPPEWLR